MPSWDVKINDEPYMLGGAPGIILGAALNEPARPTEVGSVVIATLHAGIGRSMENGILRYKEARNADLTIPGEFLPGYQATTVGSFTATGLVLSRPAFGYVPSEDGNRVFVTGGKICQTFDPEAPVSGLTNLLGAVGSGHDGAALSTMINTNAEFSGASFAVGGSSASGDAQLVFGVIRNDATHLYEPSAHLWARPGSAGIFLGTELIAYGAAGRNRAFYSTLSGTTIGLRWLPFVPGQTLDANTTKFPASGVISLGQPHVSWFSMIGKALMMFRSDGAIIGADETGAISVAGQTTLNGIDPHFARKAMVYQDGVLLGGRNGLWSFDPHSLTLRPAGPNYVQNISEERLRGEVTAVGSAGPYAFVAVRRVSATGVVTSRGYSYIKYSNMIATHDLIPETSANEVIVDFLPYYDHSLRHTALYYLVFNESTLVVTVKRLEMILPTDQTSLTDTGLAASAEVDLAPIDGPNPAANMTKLWLQVRGRFNKGAGGATLKFEDFEIDGDTVSIADVTTDGTFAVPITAVSLSEANLLGRTLTQGTLTINTPTHDSSLPLPLIFDYVWVPDTSDRITFNLLTGSETSSNNASTWVRSGWDIIQTLRALENTIVTVDFPSGDSWRVLVEAVESKEMATVDSSGHSDAAVTVQVRRLT